MSSLDKQEKKLINRRVYYHINSVSVVNTLRHIWKVAHVLKRT